jgi:aspartate-semialdehyde dehydrogenase
MAGKILRCAVVGASTLLGKELAEELSHATSVTWDISLLDAAESGGKITAVGDEALVLQPISAEAFRGIDVAFFTEATTAKVHWKLAQAAGASIIDLSGALEGLPQVVVRSPFESESGAPDATTIAVVVAHPVAMMLTLAAKRLLPLGLKRLAATVMQPASEMGSAGVDELHQQTVGLLSFQALQKDVYDAQIAFNLLAATGAAAKVDLQKTSATIVRQIELLGGPEITPLVAIQLLQAPVFHGYTASVFVEFTTPIGAEQLSGALIGDVFQLISEEGIAPNNENVSGQSDIHVSVQSTTQQKDAYWLWMAADNLRLIASSAIACAEETAGIQPASRVN